MSEQNRNTFTYTILYKLFKWVDRMVATIEKYTLNPIENFIYFLGRLYYFRKVLWNMNFLDFEESLEMEYKHLIRYRETVLTTYRIFPPHEIELLDNYLESLRDLIEDISTGIDTYLYVKYTEDKRKFLEGFPY